MGVLRTYVAVEAREGPSDGEDADADADADADDDGNEADCEAAQVVGTATTVLLLTVGVRALWGVFAEENEAYAQWIRERAG